MKRLASNTGARLEAFQSWFDRWAEGLWSFVHFNSLSGDEYQEDFLHVLHAARPRISKSLVFDHSGRKGVGDFLAVWFAKLRKTRQHSSQNHVGLSWEEQFLLFAVFRLKWPDELVAEIMRLPLSTIKYRLFTAVCKEARVDEQDFTHRDRDCPRFDLYFVDLLLGHRWSDPLGLIDRKELESHGHHCSRCQPLQETLRLCVDRLRAKLIFRIPDEFRSEIREEFGTRWQLLFSGEWFGGLHWSARIPAQIALAGLAVGGVLFLSSSAASWQRIQTTVVRVATDVRGGIGQGWVSVATAVNEWTEDWRGDSANGRSGSRTEANLPAAPLSEGQLLARALERSASIAATPAPTLPTPVATPTTLPPAPPTSAAAAGDEKLFFRWFATSADLDADGAKILEVLSRYQAAKAGDLALGGAYQGGKYFHFSVPRDSFDQVSAEIKALGLLNFRASPATSGTRKTPLDQRRAVFILMPVKKASAQPEEPGDTPEPPPNEAGPAADEAH